MSGNILDKIVADSAATPSNSTPEALREVIHVDFRGR